MKTLTKASVIHPCRHCGKESVSYYRQPMWTYPDDRTEPLPLFWYCAKHPKEVLDSLPKSIREATRLVFTQSGRETAYPDYDNRIVVGDKTVKATGRLGVALAKKKGWPSLKDKHYDEMLDKDYEKLFLIYQYDGRFKGSFKKNSDALKSMDIDVDVLVYYGEVKDETSRSLVCQAL